MRIFNFEIKKVQSRRNKLEGDLIVLHSNFNYFREQTEKETDWMQKELKRLNNLIDNFVETMKKAEDKDEFFNHDQRKEK